MTESAMGALALAIAYAYGARALRFTSGDFWRD